jgi:hypothetical protein
MAKNISSVWQKLKVGRAIQRTRHIQRWRRLGRRRGQWRYGGGCAGSRVWPGSRRAPPATTRGALLERLKGQRRGQAHVPKKILFYEKSVVRCVAHIEGNFTKLV